jgi:hypothetical protein
LFSHRTSSDARLPSVAGTLVSSFSFSHSVVVQVAFEGKCLN